MKYTLTILLLIFSSIVCFAADPITDEFSGASLSGNWSTFGSGSVAVTGGYLTLTPDAGSAFYGIKQTGISGEFDVHIKSCQPSDEGPGWEITAAARFVSLYAQVDADNKTYAYQNYDPPLDDGNNEVVLGATIVGYNIPTYGESTELSAIECVCVRLKRDSNDDFYLYQDVGCTESWVELESLQAETVRLNSSSDVDLIIQAKDDRSDKTYRVDYFRNVTEPTTEGVTIGMRN